MKRGVLDLENERRRFGFGKWKGALACPKLKSSGVGFGTMYIVENIPKTYDFDVGNLFSVA